MNDDWQLHVRREYVGGNPKFDLPTRPLGWAKLVGVFLIGSGVLFVWMPGKLAWQSIQKMLEGDSDVVNVIFGIFPLLFVAAGAMPVAIGLFILFGRCRVEWKDGRLRSAEILGPLRWTRRLPRQPVRKLEVAAATSRTGNAPPQPMEKFSVMAAEFEDGTKKVIVLGYPKDWLLALAQELRAYVGGSAFSAAAAEVEVVEQAPKDESAADVAQQPASSRVQVEERGAGVSFKVPPAGLWRGSWGLFFFALLWCGFMAVFSTLMLKQESRHGNVTWGLLAFLTGFWAIGVGLLAIAIHLGRRRATLEVDAGRLRVETRGLLGTKRREWTRADLNAIRADAGNMEVNDRPVIELQIHPRSGKKVGLLAGREEHELRWLATRLRRAMNVPARQSGSKDSAFEDPD